MKYLNKSSKGFTLVEIMIVVVIIGLLAAMAIPAFQKARRKSLETSVLNDGRQIGAAVQQYCMEYGVTVTPAITYTMSTGLLGGDANFTAYLHGIGTNYTLTLGTSGSMQIDKSTDAFFLQIKGAFLEDATPTIASFSSEGKKVSN